MNRKLIIVMIITALLAAEGCRRGGEKKPPIGVLKEKDFVFTRKSDKIGTGIDPLPKQTERNAAEQAAQDAINKAKDEAAKQKRRDDTFKMGKYLLSYRSTMKSATAYSYDHLKKDMRRKKDELHEEVLAKSIEVAYCVLPGTSQQPGATAAGQLLCYHSQTEDQLGHPAFIVDPTVIDGGRLTFLKMEREDLKNGNWKDGIDAIVKQQELRTLWTYYVKYALPNFYRENELPGLRDALIRQKIFLPATPPESPPPTFLEQLKAYKPDIVTEPGTGRNMLRFKKYLSENAPPHLLELVEAGTVRINVEADLRRHEDLLACRSTPDAENKDKAKLHYGIPTDTRVIFNNMVSFTSPSVDLYDSKQIQFWISNLKQDNTKK